MHAHRHHKLIVAALAVVGTALYLAATTLGAQTGGAIKIFALPSLTGSGGKVIITGAIGDYGPSAKTGPHGLYTMLELKKGTIVLNTTQLKKQLQKSFGHVNQATCSLGGTTTSNTPIVSGTGAYAKLSGSVTLKFTVAEIAPKKANGKCNGAAKKPLAVGAAIVGAGTVSFG